MKTPREVILERYQSAEARLAEIRKEDLAARARQSRSDSNAESGGAFLVLRFWRESLRPFRRVWLGLATVWIVIAAVKFSTPEVRSARYAVPQPNQAVLAALHDQRRLMEQLLEPAPPAPPPKPPGPRSERQRERFREAPVLRRQHLSLNSNALEPSPSPPPREERVGERRPVLLVAGVWSSSLMPSSANPEIE
jgi:hypothetical protein